MDNFLFFPCAANTSMLSCSTCLNKTTDLLVDSVSCVILIPDLLVDSVFCVILIQCQKVVSEYILRVQKISARALRALASYRSHGG